MPFVFPIPVRPIPQAIPCPGSRSIDAIAGTDGQEHSRPSVPVSPLSRWAHHDKKSPASAKPGSAHRSVAREFFPMKMDSELARLVFRLIEECTVGILTTADSQGQPHATWMNFQTKGYLEEIFTITAPNTQKIANLRANPRSEWMFFHPGFHAESIAYVTGETRIIEGGDVQPWWEATPGKSRAYFRRYCAADDPTKFAALVTKVTGATLCCPVAYHKTPVLGPAAEAAEKK
jgi:general stress protein 26